jgi:hypothetical protein
VTFTVTIAQGGICNAAVIPTVASGTTIASSQWSSNSPSFVVC